MCVTQDGQRQGRSCSEISCGLSLTIFGEYSKSPHNVLQHRYGKITRNIGHYVMTTHQYTMFMLNGFTDVVTVLSWTGKSRILGKIHKAESDERRWQECQQQQSACVDVQCKLWQQTWILCPLYLIMCTCKIKMCQLLLVLEKIVYFLNACS